MTKYPTPKQILAKRPDINPKTIEITKLWKKLTLKNWNKDENWVKISQLKMLITCIIAVEINKNPSIQIGHEYAYNPNTKTIYQDLENPSIISALHETAHYLFGPSELKACRWSIWLFKETFPKQYEKLQWKNHLLIKK